MKTAKEINDKMNENAARISAHTAATIATFTQALGWSAGSRTGSTTAARLKR